MDRPERLEGVDEPRLVPAGVCLGYARASTTSQGLEEQCRRLVEAGCYDVYADRGSSGATMARPELDECLRALEPGNTLVVASLDRLGRTVRGLVELLDSLEERGVMFRSLTEGIDTSTESGRQMVAVIGRVAEMERELIRERTKSGREAAAGKGGRPPRLQPQEVVEARRLRDQEQQSVEAIATRFEVHRSTIIRALRTDGLAAAGYKQHGSGE